MLQRSVFHAAVGVALVLLAGACGAADELRIGMPREDVVHLLGEPNRKAVLDGKVLRDVEELPAEVDASQFRLVYFYDESGLQVWFKDGKVTGVTREGIAVR